LEISRDWRLSADSRAFVGSESLLKGEIVKIHPGSRETPLEPGGELRGCGREPDLTSQLKNLTEFLQQLIEETVGPILASLNRQVQALEGLLVGGGEEGADSRQDIAGILENMRLMSEDLKSQVGAIDPQRIGEIVTSARTVAGNVEAITTSFEKRTADVERTLNDFSALARDLKNLVRTNRSAVNRSLADTQYLLQELATALTPILNNIEGASRNLLELSRDLRDNPAVLLRGRELQDNAPRR
jgi:phospholipid/cholesterol/gamma-HCH transport system substrate-binding protein